MQYYIAVFNSRAEALAFARILERNGVFSAIIQTPKEALKTCGLSVKIITDDIASSKLILSAGRYSSFYGWFVLSEQNGKRIVARE